jgi:prepilin-type N-terminal cleavage/methylation domain-containing protein
MKTLIKSAKGFTLVELMVVIVIVGILASVAIPKFLDASNKAKASEFPTQLTAVYTGEMAYNAENGTYASTFPILITGACIDINTSCKWFSYSLAGGTSSFTGTATVAIGFGTVAAGTDKGTIDQANVKSATTNLLKYCPNWK